MKRPFSLILFLSIGMLGLLTLLWQGRYGRYIAQAAEQAKDPIVCNGDKVEYFEDEKKVVGSGNVVITYQDMTLTSDKVTVWTETKAAEAEGNAKLTRGEGVLEGDSIQYNFQEDTGKISGNLKAESPPWYAKGKEGEMVSKEEYIVKKGYLTTCDHERPHWRLSANRVNIYPDVMATTYNAVAWINPFSLPWDIPVMWIPYYCHPLDDDRPHVTLIPGRYKPWGLYLLTAWRYHLTPGQKGYFRLDYREKKDAAVGMDYIYDSQLFGKGNITTYYMNERDSQLKHNYDRYTKKRWPDGWGHEKDFSWEPSTEEEKGLLRIRHQWQMAPTTQLTAEMHKYKDPELLKDYFFNEYEKDTQPGSYALLTNTGPFYNLSLLTTKRMNRFNTVTEVLPEAKLGITSQRLFKTNFYYAGDLKAVNTHQVSARHTDENPGEIPDPQHNSIYETYNQLSHNSKLGFLSVTPYIGTRQTYFEREIDCDTPQTRGVCYSGVDVSTKFFKIFYTEASPFGMEINDIRHIITPSLGYTHIAPPTMAPGKVFGDGISRSNAMSLGLENKLQTKRGENLQSVDLAMLLVATSYDFSHTPGGQLSDYTGKLELRPFDWLVATSGAAFDPHQRYHHMWLKQLDNDLSFSVEDKWSFGLGHRYAPGSNSMVLQAGLDAIPGWKFDVYEDIDIRAPGQGGLKKWEIREQQYVINKDLHCWDMEIRYNVNRDMGEEIMVVFRLKEFPDIPFEFGRSYHKPKMGSQHYQ